MDLNILASMKIFLEIKSDMRIENYFIFYSF